MKKENLERKMDIMKKRIKKRIKKFLRKKISQKCCKFYRIDISSIFRIVV